MQSAGPRLVDEFRAEVLARGVEIPGEVEECWGGFADLNWDHDVDGPTIDELEEHWNSDPAVEIKGYSRWVVFERIRGEIRYYAAPLPFAAIYRNRTDVDPARVAAIDAEPEVAELAILPSVADAVTLASEYLGGRPLKEISVPRIAPPWRT